MYKSSHFIIHNITGGYQGVAPATGQPPPPPVSGGVGGDSIRRHEVDQLINNQRDIVQTARDIKLVVNVKYKKILIKL